MSAHANVSMSGRPLALVDPTNTPIVLPGRRPADAPTSGQDAARVLHAIAGVLEQINDNPYRVAAYRRAADIIRQTDGDLHERVILGKHGEELVLPGIGERMRRKLGDLLTTGRMGFTVELRASLPEEARELLPIRSVGPRTALRLSQELGLESIDAVMLAARAGRIRRLPGFGPKRERQILRAAEALLDRGPDDDPAAQDALDVPETPDTIVNLRQRRVEPAQLRFPEAA